tara:strand:+ start:1327 stop:4551 length:3225 start_codon:yes stop_codon:yes gene_type:complete
MPTAIYDIFRYIKLYSPDGTTLEQTLEADNTQDSLSIRRGDGISWNVPTVSPGATITVTVGFDTGGGVAMGAYYLDGVEQKALTLQKGQVYTFDQTDATNSSYGGYLSPMVFSNTADGAVSGAISGEEYETGVTYLLDDVAVTKANYKLGFTGATTRKIRLELNDSAPTTFYYGSHDNVGQGGTITTTAGNDIMMIDVDYSLDVPPGTTKIELTDVNAETTHVELSAAGGIQLTRKSGSEIEIGSFAVAEIDTLHTVSKRNAITTNQLYIQDIEVGNITSSTTEDGFVSPTSEFLGNGTVGNALRLAVDQKEITSNTVTKTFTFNSKPSKGVLQYTVGYQLDSGTSATAVSASIQRFNGVTWTTLDTVSGVAGVPYEFSNLYNEADNSGGQYRAVFTISGNTGTITLELQAYYEIIEITDNPVLRTESGTGTVRTRDLAPLGVNDIGRGSEPYDNVYANTFHGHLQGTFDGDITGSVYSDDSTVLIDGTDGKIKSPTVSGNIVVENGHIDLDDSYKLKLGTHNDLEIYHDGNHNWIDGGQGNTSANTYIRLAPGAATRLIVDNGTNTAIEIVPDALISLNYAGFQKFVTQGDGTKTNGTHTASVRMVAPEFVGDVYGSVFGPDSTTVVDNNGTVLAEVNNSQVTTANAEIANFTDTVGTITGGNITGFKMMSDAYGTNGTSKLVDATANQIVGEVNADTNRTGALTIASDTSITMSGTGVIKFNNGVGVDANGKLANVANAAQPFTIASPVTLERELRSSPGIQEKMLYTNVSTGIYEIDTTDTQNVYWNAPSGALVANFTGLETSTQRVRRVRIHIVQGGTAYIPTIEVNGVTQTPTDLGAVSSAINSLNIYEYTFYRTHTNTWEIYRQQVDGSLSLVDTQINGDLAFYSDDGATLAGTITNNNNRLEFNNEDGTRMFYFDDTQNWISVDRPISVSTSHYVSTTKIQQGAGAAGDITIEPGATSGEVIISGPLTAAGAFTGSRQTISGPGAINLTTLYTEITTTGADTFTLANGAIGQMKIIVMVVDGGNATITPTTFANGTSITMDAVNDSVTMIYGANGWQIIAAQAIDII